jgi:hypothetical protein
MNSAAHGEYVTVRTAYYHFVWREESCDAIRTFVLSAYMGVVIIIIIISIIIVIVYLY